jgi:hypothetical protein
LSQVVDVVGQILNEHITSAIPQNGWDREYAFADLIVCGSQLDTDFLGGQ